ncbi:response regulator [Natrinema sp. 1APR25-10V2]|uniref:response regulator n=1 Tax=Natrinema sp. 1APR25-10V2 TaxID=2951081 RepID=UPI00287702A1|nr:response regulator [Natrinema sp. 1APR25-10V2]MDS0477480.1 response regulator [Natrinema sp. 1APR25-10V2]
MRDEPADPVDVLVIEDDADDVRRIRDAFAGLCLEISIDVAADGEEALAILTDRLDDPSSMPDLVLLDLDLPQMSGLEFLETISDEPALTRLPILVLTRSASLEDIDESYDLAANAYLTKPTDESGYDELVTAVAEFWFERAVLPTDAL